MQIFIQIVLPVDNNFRFDKTRGTFRKCSNNKCTTRTRASLFYFRQATYLTLNGPFVIAKVRKGTQAAQDGSRIPFLSFS